MLQLIDALKSIGYRVEGSVITCDLEEALRRNASRGDDDISAYYAEPFQRAWIIDACAELRARARNSVGPAPRFRSPQEADVQKILYIDMDGVLVDFKSGLERIPRRRAGRV